MKPATILLCLGVLIPSPLLAAPTWHHPLYVGNGGFWKQRVAVTLTNDMPQPAEGDPVNVAVGKAPGQADLVGAAAEAVRVCDAAGTEMLYAITGDDGKTITRGPIPAGATLTLPAECPANGTATYFVYFDNPEAWPVPDFLPGLGGLRNGDLEAGEGDTPNGWQHDANDDQHRTYWVTENPHSGKKCLKTVVAEGAEHTWIATRQRGIHVLGGAKYVMTAWVRAEDVKGFCGWYLHVGNAQNTMLTSPMLTAGEGTFGWKEVRAEFVAPPEANLADLGTVLRGTGTAWFDDVQLSCNVKPKLHATAGRVERLELRQLGAHAPWADQTADYRVPLRVTNLDEDQPVSGMLSVDLSTAFARLRGRVDRDSLRVIADGKAVPFYQLKEVLLFEGDAPPLTAKTHYLYCRTTAAMAPPEKPATLSQNPALPGGEPATAERALPVGDYEALLNSPRNLVKNGSFEDGEGLPTAWPGGAEGERPADTVMTVEEGGLFGKRCAKVHVPATSQKTWTGWRQDVPVKPGKTYLFAAWIKTEDVTPSVQLHAHYRNAQGELCASKQYTGAGPGLNGTSDWTMLSGLFKMPPDVATFQLHLTMNATGTVWHDGAVLFEVAAGEALKLQARAASSLEGLTVWPVSALVKTFREDVAQVAQPVARITCARNEREPLQLALRSPESMSGLRVVADAPAGPKGARLPQPEVNVVGYVPIDHKTSYYQTNSPTWHRKFPTGPGTCDGWSGWWPDPLLPRNTFDLPANTTQPVWLTITVPKGVPEGDYHGTVRFVRNGNTVKDVAYTVHVWNFTLPDESHVKAIYDCRQGPQWSLPGKTREEQLRQMWRFMADRRVCPDSIRTDPKFTFENGRLTADFTAFDQAATYYFDELKLPHAYTPRQFYCFGWGHLPGTKFGEKPYEGEYPYKGVDRSQLRPEYKRKFQACLKAFWDHVKQKGWANRITFYISDEPYDSDEKIRAQMKALCDMIHEVDPAIPIYCSNWHAQPEWEGYLNVWGLGHYGVVPEEKIRALQKSGATIWWTTDGQMCTDTPYCAIERLLPHYCFKYGAEAYEFWGLDWLTYNPYEYGWHRYNLHNFGPDRDPVYVRYPNGDGFLAYPGQPLGHDGPVSSLRLEQAREGVEDYEYLYLLRQRVAAAKAAGKDVTAAQRALDLASELVSMPCAIGRYSTKILPEPEAVFEVKEAVARAVESLGE